MIEKVIIGEKDSKGKINPRVITFILKSGNEATSKRGNVIHKFILKEIKKLMKTYNKLVRDKIPEIINSNNSIAVTRILDDKEYLNQLNKKLEEEVKKYLEDNNVEELADIVEVIYGILNSKNVLINEFETIRKNKVDKRGAFNKKIFLEKVIDNNMIKIKFDKNNNKSIAYDNNIEIGECEFIEQEESWNIMHTEVNNLYQGQGIARKLVECVIENSKKYNKNIVAECSYAKRVLDN